jgi:DNA polymerase III subunit delta
MRHALILLQARLKIEDGQSLQVVGEAMRLPYPRKAAAQAALAHWSSAALISGIRGLGQSVAEARKTAPLAADMTQRVLLSISQKARRKT